MKALRTIAAVVAGYFLYALGSMLIVMLLAIIEGSIGVLLALAALVGIGLCSGLAVVKIAGRTARTAGLIVAALVALASLANLFLQLGAEPTWYKAGTLLLTVPSILWMTSRPRRAPRPKD